MLPTKEHIEGILASNVHWVSADKLAISPSSIPIHKNATLNKILKDLSELAADDELYCETMMTLKGQMASTDWTFKCGTYPIWKAMLSRAKNSAKQKLSGKNVLDNLTQGLLNNGKHQRRGC